MTTEERLIAMDDRIDAYLSGQMTTWEERQFLEDFVKDKELKKRIYMTVLLAKSLE